MPNIDELLDSLHIFEKKLLKVLTIKLSLEKASKLSEMEEIQALKAAQWLSNKELAIIKETKKKSVALTNRGREVELKGFPEIRLLNEIKDSEKKIDEIKSFDKNEFNKALGLCKKEGFLSLLNGVMKITGLGNDYLKSEEKKKKILESINEKELSIKDLKASAEEIKELSDRGLISLIDRTDWEFSATPLGLKLIKKGINLDEELLEKPSAQMIKSKEWENKKFRRYNVKEPVPPPLFAKKHPYNEFINEIKSLFVSMGFKEMTGNYVETNFTNCDALYMPQDHPARAVHDIFYVEEPQYSDLEEYKKFIKKVRIAHEKGIKGSAGWGIDFDENVSKAHVLRSQTTSASIRKLMSKDLEIPGKYFIIDRVARPDVIDRTHGAEFLQMEGIILGEGMNLASLLSLLRMFAEKIAKAKKYLIMPDYYPYTEPSASLHIFTNNKWVELGGAGIFRKEVTEPAGVKVPVIAWGMGFDRAFMSSYGINDIREIFSTDISWLRNVEVKK
ncbi:MAG: phenylalanine--tRNA ligase subunit alpha [Candidatus Nanoarchaeia archaeon]|nr:phenylalanine--tRNA ligase subunit alpha [Candidatus Nanoarchaeia archaeon]